MSAPHQFDQDHARADIAVIRTHRWGAAEQRLAQSLGRCFADVVIAFHNPPADLPADLPPDLRVLPLTDGWLTAHGLRVLPRYGWLCGDYCYYLARQSCPNFRNYWLVESDVFFQGDPAEFFAQCANSSADGLAAGIRNAVGTLNPAWISSIGAREPVRAFFPVTRLSGAAIDYLFDARRTYSASAVGNREFCNDSLFVFSWLQDHPHMTIARLESLAPDWFSNSIFRPDPDILAPAIPAEGTGLWHPVRERSDFIRVAAARAAEAVRKSVLPSASALTPQDLADLSDAFLGHLQEQCARARPAVPAPSGVDRLPMTRPAAPSS